MKCVVESTDRGVRIIQLNHSSQHNPFSEELEDHIKEALYSAQNDDLVKSVVVYGGKNRSFSSGGDFNEVKNLSGGDDVDRWIDRIIELYSAVLNVDKPTVAAVDGYAIGMGFQFCMMFDWAVMSDTGKFAMPELKHGIGCTFGAAILSSALTYKATQEIIYGCEEISADKALGYNIVNQIVKSEYVLAHAVEMATKMQAYPKVAFRNTKTSFNAQFLADLQNASDTSKRVHRAAFADKAAQRHFANVLGDKYQSTDNVAVAET